MGLRKDKQREHKRVGGLASAVQSMVVMAARLTVWASRTLWKLLEGFLPELAPLVAGLATYWLAMNYLVGSLPLWLGRFLAVSAAIAVGWALGRKTYTRAGLAASAKRRAWLRRRRDISERFPDVADRCRLGVDGDLARITAIAQHPAGVVMDIELPTGLPVGSVQRSERELARAFGARSAHVSENEDTGLVRVTMLFDNPLAQVLTGFPLITAATPRPFTDPVPVGLYEDGNPFTLTLAENSILIAGAPGSGKSSVEQLLVSAVALSNSDRVKLYLFDPKETELGMWANRAERFVSNDIGQAIEVLQHLVDEMYVKTSELAKNGGSRKIDFDTDEVTVVVLDELATYTADAPANQRKEFTGLLTALVRVGRAAGYIVIAATQRPTKDVVPGSLSQLMSTGLAMRTKDEAASRLVLGEGVRGAGAAASIPNDATSRGVGVARSDDSDGVKRFRSYYLSDEELAGLVARAGGRAGELSEPAEVLRADLLVVPDRRRLSEAIVETYGSVDNFTNMLRAHHKVALLRGSPEPGMRSGLWLELPQAWVRVSENMLVEAVHPRT